MLKEILRDQECNSNEDIEAAMMAGGNDLAFDEVQGVFQKWMRSGTCIIENGREYTLVQNKDSFLGRGPGHFVQPGCGESRTSSTSNRSHLLISSEKKGTSKRCFRPAVPMKGEEELSEEVGDDRIHLISFHGNGNDRIQFLSRILLKIGFELATLAAAVIVPDRHQPL
jgi:hypothetical protein